MSGGPDSLALLMLAARWRSSRGGVPRLTVLTVDHGLAARIASGGPGWWRVWRESFGLPHAILNWAHDGMRRGGALQEAARAARYGLMTAYCHAP